MATDQVKIHFLATKGPLPEKSTKSPGSNAIIIQDFKNGKYTYGMIDVGYWKKPSADEDASRVLYDKTLITKYLKRHSITELEYIIITHYHVDHFRGLGYLLDTENGPNIKIKKLILPMNLNPNQNKRFMDILKSKVTEKAYTTACNAYSDIIKWYNNYKETYPDCQLMHFRYDSTVAEIRTACQVGKGKFAFYNTNPETDAYEKLEIPESEIASRDLHKWSIDKFSIVTRYEVDGKRILFPADIYAYSENLMLARDIGSCDVVQMSHHGSVNGNSETFLKYVIGGVLEDEVDETTYKNAGAARPCSAIQLRAGGKSTNAALDRYRSMNKSGFPLVRIYGVWQKFDSIWNPTGNHVNNVSDDKVASIVLEIRDGAIRYCTRRFTDDSYAQKTIPEDESYNITDSEISASDPVS